MIGDMPYAVTYHLGMVRVHLPYAVDSRALSELLYREGFGLAHGRDTPDIQGWGDNFDPMDYYPYWVDADPGQPGCSVFAFYPQPEDVIDQGNGKERAVLGKRSLEVVHRWVPVLARLPREHDRH